MATRNVISPLWTALFSRVFLDVFPRHPQSLPRHPQSLPLAFNNGEIWRNNRSLLQTSDYFVSSFTHGRASS